MRVIPLPAMIKLVWSRIIFSRLTTAYFIFSVIHFIIQIALQIEAFTINANAANFLFNIVEQGNAISTDVPVLGADLRLCHDLRLNLSTAACPVVWNGTPSTNNTLNNQPGVEYDMATSSFSSLSIVPTSVSSQASSFSVGPSTSQPVQQLESSAVQSTVHERHTVTVTIQPPPTTSSATNDAAQTVATPGNVDLNDDDGDNNDFKPPAVIKRHVSKREDFEAIMDTVSDRHTCLVVLNWPVSILDNTKREDIVFVAFQFWVLGMSVVALLNESIPHIIASLLTHILATAWAAFQISHTALFRADFARLVTKGACRPAMILPIKYWEERSKAEISSLALNVLALFISSFLTWRLIKLFGWQTFKRVGASLAINRVYKLVLTLSITIQLSLFFMVSTVGLWIDQLFNGVIAKKATYATLYKVNFLVTLILLVPWLMTGWFAVRREQKIPMLIFLALSFAYLVGWGVMFLSTTFRWTYVQWQFFGAMASASVILTLMSAILGVICRFNFGKGLSRYLNAHQTLPGDDFTPVTPGGTDLEKVAFPSNEKPIPTYSATFGSGPEVPLPTQMFASRMGPRFFNASTEPFEFQSNPSLVTAPLPVLTRTESDKSSKDVPLVRRGTRESDRSTKSSSSSSYSYSRDSDHSRNNSQSTLPGRANNGKRWVIE